MRLFILTLAILFQAKYSKAQVLNTAGIERNLMGNHVLFLTYENDLFTGTDYYHTQGFQLNYSTPKFQKKWLTNALLLFKGTTQQVGLGFEQNNYTPTNLAETQVLDKDRPYAGIMALNIFGSIINYENQWRASSQLSLGILGPSALGKEIQVYIHEITQNVIPQGWHNQVKDDFLMNYQYQFEKSIWNKSGQINALANGTLNLGTVFSNASLGGKIIFGLYNDPFRQNKEENKFQIFGYTNPKFSFVAYDATLQGGFLDYDNFHYIKPTNVTRFVFRNDWGITIIYSKWMLEYFQSFMTKEFRHGLTMRNGGIRIGYRL